MDSGIVSEWRWESSSEVKNGLVTWVTIDPDVSGGVIEVIVVKFEMRYRMESYFEVVNI